MAGCGPSTLLSLNPEFGPWPSESPDSTWRLLNRITFGPRPEERSRAAEIGLAAFIEEQLAPETLPEKKIELRRLRKFAEDAKKAKEKYERKMKD